MKKSGFTIIELLAVIVIMFILLGIIFRMGAGVGYKIKISQTVSRLEHLKCCVEEYYEKYGNYPPTTGSTECYWINNQERFGLENLYGAISAAYEESGNVFNVHDSTLPAFLYQPSSEVETMTYIEIGEYRDLTGWDSHWPQEDPELQVEYGEVMENSHPSVGHYIFSNRVYTIVDSWGGLFHYSRNESSQSYHVWSNGPDGVEGTADDIGYNSFVN